MGKFIPIIVLLTLTACAKATMTGKAFPPVDSLDVKVLFEKEPECDYEEIAFIATSMLWDQNHAVNMARKKAASIGADYINIKKHHFNVFNDASVSAMAYRCGDVDRERVEVRG